MTPWQADLLNLLSAQHSEDDIFAAVQQATRNLGFDYAAYGIRLPTSFTNPKIVTRNDYPEDWWARYCEANYLHRDPVVKHGRSTQTPVLWGRALFADAPDLWRDAQDFGIRHGWSQSSFNAHGAAGMLSLVRGQGRISPMELKAKEQNMRWLVSLTHLSLSRVYLHHEAQQPARLTQREIEAMKWTADGKSAQEIADILNITKHAVDFHLKNAIQKLQTSNKTAAVARAAVLGLLN